MNKFVSSDKIVLFLYFIANILIGALLLTLGISSANGDSVGLIDALFTSVSAVCVTGLVTIPTSSFSLFGQIVILFLIQSGGLGIITLSTLYIAIPGRRISLKNRRIIANYYIESIESDPLHIVRNVILTTFSIEILGVLALYLGFSKAGSAHPLYHAIFHSISAFCNAGFSVFDNSLENYQNNLSILVPIMLLIITGGIGFLVMRDIAKALIYKKKLTLHSKIVLFMSLIFIILGALAFFLLEKESSMSGFNTKSRLISSFFQSITTRTAGFNTINEAEMSNSSSFISILLMFIGGSSGSTAGGIKVTTVFLIILAIIKPYQNENGVVIQKRTIPMEKISMASNFLVRALALILLSILLLTLIEPEIAFSSLVFEVFSAIGTVGLSQGVTSNLSILGKIIIIFTMFIGRVGLFSMVMESQKDIIERKIKYPIGEVMIG